MINLLWRSSLRYLGRHPWLAGLSVLGVALGVAVVVAIDLANASASRAFELSAATVTGQATHQVVSTTPQGLDEEVYRKMRVEGGLRQTAPVVEGHAKVPALPGRTFRVLGIDPLAEAPFRPYLSGKGMDLSAFMARPRTALLATSTAQELGIAPGDSLHVRIAGTEHVLTLAGRIEPQNERSARALSNLLVVDIATAQALFDQTGTLSRIDLILPGGEAGARQKERIRSLLPEGAELRRSASRTETIEQMTRAFNLNLSALSLLALVVGMFLIYNTMTFSVVQRRLFIGRLRALGVRRREVFSLILGEALIIGTTGTVIGVMLGIVMAQGLVELVTQTINDLYYVLSVRELTLAPLTLLKGVGIGLGATLLAALAPAREATAASARVVLQRSTEETKMRKRIPRLVGGAVLLGACSAGLLLWPSQSIVLSYVALLFILMAFAMITPGLVVLFSRSVRPLMNRLFGVLGRMAARGIYTALSRTAIAIAALAIAIAATVGVGVMVDSFRSTVSTWLNYSLRADVYIQAPSLVFRRATAALNPEVVDRLKKTPGVAGAYTVRNTRVGSPEGPVELVVIDPGPSTPNTFRFKSGRPEAIWTGFEKGRRVIVSEPFSFRRGVGVGDTLQLETDRGLREFAVRGVFYDYASDQGIVMMSRAVYNRYYEDRQISGLALDASAGLEVDALIERLRRRAEGGQEVIIRSNRALREHSLAVFDRTFTITVVLRLLAVVVAFMGVLSALMALQLERSHELAVLRANGMTTRQVGKYVTLQTGLMGGVAGLLSLPLGLALAYVLIYVINRRSFGWTLQFEVAPGILWQALALAVAAALLAGLYPAWKMTKTPPADALRGE